MKLVCSHVHMAMIVFTSDQMVRVLIGSVIYLHLTDTSQEDIVSQSPGLITFDWLKLVKVN